MDFDPTTHEHFTLSQKVTMMVNRYEFRASAADGGEGPLLAFAQQKRVAAKEKVTFYADPSRSQEIFGFRARKRIDLASGYDVAGVDGSVIGEFRKDFGKSLLRSTWHIAMPSGLTALGQERSQGVAIARRVIGMVGELPIPLKFHFDFTSPSGEVVLSSTRKTSLRDRYVITVPQLADGTRLDWRMAASMAVALDALQSR